MITTSKLFRPVMNWRSLLLVAVASLALIAVACASDGAEPTAVPAAAISAPADTAVPAEGDDAMADDDAMMDEGAAKTDDAMMDDGDVMTDDAMMDDGDVMIDDAAMMDDGDAMADDVMMDDGDAMADDAMMDDGDAMFDDAHDDAMMDDGSSVQSGIESFKLENLTVSVGDVVTWTNQDTAPHTVTHGTSPDVGSSPEFQSDNLAQEQSYSHTFRTAGTFAYFCEVHPSMTGTVTVGEVAASSGVSDPAPVTDPGY